MAGRKIGARPERERLAQLIAAKRQKLGLSQRELSRKLGWHEMTVHLIETGQRGIEVIDLVDLAKVIEEDPVEMLRRSVASEDSEG